MPKNGISGTTDNKTFTIRKESPQFLILTNSVTYTLPETLLALYNNGNSRSVHYLINQEGHQDQFTDEDLQSFTNGKSFFRGHSSLNQTAVNVMLLNNGNESYTEAQKDKLKAFLIDFRERNPGIDLKINLLGLGEVATVEKSDVPEGEGKLFPRHQAPGKIFWLELVEELAKQGFGLFIPTTLNEKAEALVSPASSPCDIIQLQNNLRDYGYALEASGKYDEATKAWVTRFNERYVPDATQTIDASIWSKASQKNLDNILHHLQVKTCTQHLQSHSLFRRVAPTSDVDMVDVVQDIQLSAG